MHTDFSNIDREALARDIDAIRDEIGDPAQADLDHLKKVERWGRIAAVFGYSIAWLIPFNPIAALLISIGNITRWANVAHPVLHGAYDKVPGVPKRYTRKGFAHGKRRRLVDWLDWIEPKAWIHEHNIMHHYHLGELDDPDHIEHNMAWLRESRIPMALRYLIVIVFAGIWKLAYYAPNTLKILGNKRRRRQGQEEHDSFLRRDAWSPFGEDGRELWLNFYLPYALFRFVLLPAPFLLISPQAALNVLLTSLLAELFANLHSFLVIIPNHSAADIYRFDEPIDSKGEFYLRQIMGSVNYTTGSDSIDFLHGWLNYQIEHHLFPFLPLSQYQQMRPLVQKICRDHGLPYRQDSVFTRLGMTLDLMVGKTSLLRVGHV